MGINRIDKKSYPYLFLKHFVAFWHNHVFYQRIVIQNRDQIPENAHLIFTGNHQNALMDALVFLFTAKSRMVFMARSDIYKKPFIGAILYFLRMLPIFRIKDGFSEVKKNDKIFQKTIDVIKNKIGLVIMPEGNHGDKRRLRDLKKGFARIAFQTEEANDFQLNMQVIPVGIDYSNYENFRSELFVNFGKPIPVSDYYESYKNAPAIAINQIKEQLAESLIPLMVQIKSEKHYDLYNELREIYKNEMIEKMGFPSSEQPFKLQTDKELISRLEIFEEEHPEQMDSFQKMVLRYRDNIQKQKLSYNIVREKTCSNIGLLGKLLLLVLASPIFLIGWILNYIPFGLSIYIGLKMKDPQFKSSVKFVISMIFWPLFHFLETLIVWFIFKDWTIVLGFFVAMPILGILARGYWVSFKKYLKALRWSRLKKNNIGVYQSIKNNQQEILSKTATLFG
ncbi:MAG: 1-acyl-sn-glycerol-3-phosphate acyltransferase [Bacteroidales bacterium]|jgi:1-acyl-sn-glycerol-3-phosphate acyltransferase|nr:1-acyl-sn-glycerol-3-phosphate acyltransferase [Bacteroidales bacterium]